LTEYWNFINKEECIVCGHEIGDEKNHTKKKMKKCLFDYKIYMSELLLDYNTLKKQNLELNRAIEEFKVKIA
jgi:hypothetical protein